MANIQLKDNTGAALYPKTLWDLISGAPQILQTINTTNPSTTNILSEKAVKDALGAITAESLGAATTTYVNDKINGITPASIGAVAMVTSPGRGRVYGITAQGVQITRDVTGNATPSTLMYRETNGDCQIQDPKNAKSVANKQYVDNSITKAMAQAGKKPTITWEQTEPGTSVPIEGTINQSAYYYAYTSDGDQGLSFDIDTTVSSDIDAELFLTSTYGRQIHYTGEESSIETYCDKTLNTILDEFNTSATSDQPSRLYLHIVQGNLVAYSYHIA